MTEWEEKLDNMEKNLDLSDENIKQVCANLFDIVQNQPDLSDKVLDFTEHMIKKKNYNFITPIYVVLGQVAHVSSEAKIRTLDLFLNMAKDERNSINSFHVASSILCNFSHKIPLYLDTQLHNPDSSDFIKMKYRMKRHPIDDTADTLFSDDAYMSSQGDYKQEIKDRQVEVDKKVRDSFCYNKKRY